MPQSILFVCTMNAVRSPMACAIFQFLTGNAIRADSAGVRPQLADPFVVAVMDEIGIDLSDFQPKALAAVRDQHFDLIVSLSPEGHHHAIELTRMMAADVRYWPTLDVTAFSERASRDEKLARYRALRESFLQRIKSEFPIAVAPKV